jgi:hypothetical protein
MVGLLVFPILPVGWLHADGKFIIYGLCFFVNHVGLNMLTVPRITSLSL